MSTNYFDTSILLPLCVDGHPHHKKCLKLFKSLKSDDCIISCTPHAFAEMYNNLTRLPFDLTLKPEHAYATIMEYISKLVQTVDLNAFDYQLALKRCAEKRLVSGVIYDALHLQAAIKAEVDAFYTANVKDFERLWDEEVPFPLKGIG